jgi:hypothetical protein
VTRISPGGLRGFSPDDRHRRKGLSERFEAAPGVFRILIGQRAGVDGHVEFRRDPQDLAALNTREFQLAGLGVADREPEMLAI